MPASVLEALREITATEWIAVAFALAYVVLAIRQNVYCWAASIVSSGLYGVLFWRSHLVMQVVLQLFYVVMAVYGWWAWRHGSLGAQHALPVTRWPVRRHLIALVVIALLAAINGRWIAGAGGSVVPYVDALVTWVSFFATWLVARKVLENWLYWIVIDLVAAGLYGSQGLRATGCLFVIYSLMAVRGYLQWRADLQGTTTRNGGAAHA
jgi:nicotinamide mononucleotide transporter